MASRLAEMFGAGAAETFLGLPRAEVGALPDGVAAAVLGADTATPYASVGAYCAGGAAAIRAGAADFAANREHVNFDLGVPLAAAGALVDAGDIAVDPGDAAGNRARIADAVAAAMGKGAGAGAGAAAQPGAIERPVPVLLGGDDSLPIPVLEAFADRGPVWVVQVDAHIDWRDAVDGERLGLSSPMRRASEMDHVAGLVQVGARGIGSARAADLADAEGWGARLHPMRDVARDGIGPALADVPAGADVVLCFDFDVLDPAVMPAVIARTPGGMGYWQALELIAGVAGKARIRAAVFAEFMAERDIDGLGARSAAGLVMATLGLVARARARV